MYPMEDSAMRYINKIGNRSFQYIISKVIGINLSDTLCGTKILKGQELTQFIVGKKTLYIGSIL